MSNIGHSVGPTEPFSSASKIAPYGKYDGIVFENLHICINKMVYQLNIFPIK